MLRLLTLGAALLVWPPAYAEPSQIIIARHAEKGNSYALCDMGNERAQGALRRALSPTFRLARCCSLSLGGGGRPGFWRGAARPARAADFSI